MNRTKLTKILSCMVVAMGLTLAGCKSDDDQPDNIPNEPQGQEEPVNVDEPTEDAPFYQISLTSTQEGIRDKSNEFAVEFFKSIGEPNSVVAPFSVFTTLSMIANGDDGEIQEEILSGFGLQKGELDQLNAYVKTMNEGFSKVYGKTRFCYANSIWVKGGGTCLPAFENAMKGFYNAEMKEAFADGQKNMEVINAWIADKTNNLLKDFLNGPVMFDAALVNTLYFKGGWQTKFSEENTAKGKFTCKDNTTSEVSFMNAIDELALGKSDGAVGVGLLLGKGNFRITFITKDAANDGPSLLDNMDGQKLTSFLKSMKKTKVKLSVPKFDNEFKAQCEKNLSNMGFAKVFSNGFNGILADNTLYFTALLHGSRLKIDEEGVEGAGASAAFSATSAGEKPSVDPVTVTFDRPFIYVLEEVSTGTILFIGDISSLK